MKKNSHKNIKSKRGTTFIELLLYISIFLILMPILLAASIHVLRLSSQHNTEKQVFADSQLVSERIYDLITNAKKVDTKNSIMGDPAGKLALVMQDDSTILIAN